MKYGLLTILTVLGLSTFGQITWTGPIDVDPGNTSGDNTRPRVVVTQGGDPLVIWHSPGTIWSAQYTGGSFTTPQQINPANTDPHISNWTSTEVAATGDTVFVVYETLPMETGHVYVQKSIDGGLTWGDTVRVDFLPSGGISAFPNIAVSPSGNPTVSFMRHDANWLNPHYVVANSSDGGATFAADVDASQAIGGAEVCDCCPSYMHSEGNRQVLIFRNNDNNLRDMWVSVSQDGGATFTGSDVDPNNWNISACPSTGADALSSGDSLTFTWVSGASGSWVVNISTIDMNTQQVGQYGELGQNSTGGVNHNFPKIAGVGDNLMMVFEYSSAAGADAHYVYSSTGVSGFYGEKGDTLHTNTLGTQRNPHVTFHGGQFYVVYQDESTDNVEFLIGTIDNYTGVGELADKNINVYPNPAVDQVTIDGVEGYERLELMDASGRSLRSMSLRSDKVVLDVDGLPAGNYVVRLATAEGNFAQRSVVVR